MREYVDMHVHSTASDGSYTPEELADYAEQKQAYAIVVSDHDTVAGIAPAKERAASCGYGVRIISGIEFSTAWHKGDIHVLGIGIDETNPEFLRELHIFQESRTRRNEKMMARMAECGFPVSEEAKKRYFQDSSVTRAHFARFLMESGAVETVSEAFAKYLNPGCPCYVPREKITPFDALKFIRLAHGHAVLAHPMLYFHLTRDELDGLVGEMAAQGMEGIETFYSTNTPEEEAFTKSLAEKYHLKMTGGSDFHGIVKPDIDLMTGRGNLRVEKKYLLDLCT